jgi:hypothetical protein
MARYVVTVFKTIYESAEVEVEANSREEAKDIVFDQVASGDVEFEFDDTDYEIPDRNIVEDDAD